MSLRRSYSTLLGVAAAFAAVSAPASAAIIKVDDNKVQCKTAQYTDIQSAIDAASNGDSIQVCAGTYPGQLEVDKSVKILSVTRRAAIITAPAQLSANQTVVNFKGPYPAGQSAQLSKFVVDAETLPEHGASCDGDIWGVRLVQGAKATINDNEIINARPSDDALLGCQYGIALAVGGYYDPDNDGVPSARTTGDGTLNNNDIHGYAKLGMYIDNDGTKAIAKGNHIAGDGCVAYVAQNGVQVSRGAKGTLQTNVIENNCYSEPEGVDDYYAAGILMYRAGAGSLIGGAKAQPDALGNTLNNNDYGLDIEDSQKSTYGHNHITGSSDPTGVGIFVGQFEGIAAELNKFFSNTSYGNDRYDCEDTTSGAATAGTGNTWQGNLGDTSSPSGICTPAPPA
jgi:hypothetical protein